MRNKVRLASAAAVVVMLSLGTLAVVAGPSTSRTNGSEADSLATGLERAAAGEGEEGKPVRLDPNAPTRISAPKSLVGKRGTFVGDVRTLPTRKSVHRVERPEYGQPVEGTSAPTTSGTTSAVVSAGASTASLGTPFQGLNYAVNGDGFPPDTSGDVGPTYYIQAVNTSIGIYNKSTGNEVNAFTFDDFFSGTGTVCDANNYGDPVVVYDTFSDRWIISDFAFTLDASGRLTSDSYQCFAVSKSGDPTATNGWYFYAFNVAQGGAMADYPKLGVWPDGVYMSANVFGTSTFKNVRVWSFNKSDLYSGAAAPRAVQFDLPQSIRGTTIFSLLPSNARAQTGTPPAGAPNLFASIYGSYNVRVWKFSANWGGTATLTGPTNIASGSFSVGPNQATSPQNPLDTLTYRLMMQNQYSNIGGVESLWLSHTVGANSLAAPRWYQVPVTGGTVGSLLQSVTYQPDTNLHRYMPSLAVDKLGNMAIGYTASSGTVNPAIRFAGRLATDAANTMGVGETTLVAGGGSQSGTFRDGSLISRWGDYSSMSLDPDDGCTFWYTTEIYDADGHDWHTRVASFSYPTCVNSTNPPPVAPPADPGANALSGTVVSKNRINLAWPDWASTETGYKVERSTNGTTWTLIATTAANATGYASTGLSRNTLYYYRVRATNSGGDSANTNTWSGRTLN